MLQKALRRNDRTLVSQALDEIDIHDSHILTYMFEDRSLVRPKVLEAVAQIVSTPRPSTLVENKKRTRTLITLLLNEDRPSRVAACLPVVAELEEYLPPKNIHVASMLNLKRGLTNPDGAKSAKDTIHLDSDVLFALFATAWYAVDNGTLIAATKMISIMMDGPGIRLSEKYQRQLAGSLKVLGMKVSKKNGFVQYLLTTIYHSCNATPMRVVLGGMIRLCAVPNVNTRLLLSSVVGHFIVEEKLWNFDLPGNIVLPETPPMTKMADWAVDKHTTRGRLGCSTLNAYRQAVERGREFTLTAEQLTEFHGERPKKDLEDFFEEGTLLVPADTRNEWWDRAKEVYRSQSKNNQKTVKMSGAYVASLKSKPCYRYLFRKKTVTQTDGNQPKIVDLFEVNTKRSASVTSGKESSRSQPSKKKVAKLSTPGTSRDDEPIKRPRMIASTSEISSCHEGKLPLLKAPNGSNKTYTRADLVNRVVRKGPMSTAKCSKISARHMCLKEVFMDEHVLAATNRGHEVEFPLVHDPSVDMGKIPVLKCEYLDSRVGGVCKDSSRQVVVAPMIRVTDLLVDNVNEQNAIDFSETVRNHPFFLAHFVYMFILGIGDANLSNTCFCKDGDSIGRVYGVDLDEDRALDGRPPPTSVIEAMFSKMPRKELREIIVEHVREKKLEYVTRLREAVVQKNDVGENKLHCFLARNPALPQFFKIRDVDSRTQHLISLLTEM